MIAWLVIAIDYLLFTLLTDVVSFDSRLRNCVAILPVGVAVSVIFFSDKRSLVAFIFTSAPEVLSKS